MSYSLEEGQEQTKRQEQIKCQTLRMIFVLLAVICGGIAVCGGLGPIKSAALIRGRR